MPNINELTIMGHVGREPEMRYTQNGTAVTRFSCAVNRKYKKNDGKFVEDTDWFNVVTWGKLAETVNQYVTKGQLVLAKGRVQLNTWVNEKKESMANMQLNAVQVIFLDKPSGTTNSIPSEVDQYEEYMPDDIPF